MAGMLRASAIGHLGGPPESRFLDSGQQVSSFSVGCSVGTKDKPHTEWVRCSAWGRLAETAQQYLEKGKQVYVEGRMTSRSYQAADGATRFSIELNVDVLQMLGSAQSQGGEVGRAEMDADAREKADLDAIPF